MCEVHWVRCAHLTKLTDEEITVRSQHLSASQEHHNAIRNCHSSHPRGLSGIFQPAGQISRAVQDRVRQTFRDELAWEGG